MGEDVGERTERATPRRRREARQRGQNVESRDFSGAVMLLAAVIAFHIFGMTMVGDAADVMRYCLREPWIPLRQEDVRTQATALMVRAAVALAPWIGLVFAVSFLTQVIMVEGIEVRAGKNYIRISQFNPIQGVKRLVSLRGLVKTGLDIAKVLLLGSISYWFIAREMSSLAALAATPFPPVVGYAFGRALTLAYYLAAALMILGIADYAYQKYQFEKDLRMTKQEVKEEHKDLEGDPKIKARRRRMQLEMATKRMMAAVPEAEVVITNPTHFAVALHYKPETMDAPVLVAKGADLLAQRIREEAAKHNVPVIENKPLARLLYFATEVGGVIPEDSFVTVAEILAYVYQITGMQPPLRPEERQ